MSSNKPHPQVRLCTNPEVSVGHDPWYRHSACVLEIGARPSVPTSGDAARKSVPIAFRTTMGMKTKDLPKGASCVFEGACATIVYHFPDLPRIRLSRPRWAST